MSVITFRIPEHAQPVRVELTSGEALLVGRRPSPERLAKILDADDLQTLARYQLRCLVLDSPRVSACHLLLVQDGDTLRSRDLRSRNGSWQRLSSVAWTSVSAASSIELVLTSTWQIEGAPQQLGPAEWTVPQDYPEAVRCAVETWLDQQGITAKVEVLDAAEQSPAAGLVLQLASGGQLRVLLSKESTQERSWQALQDALVAFVHEENRRYSQLTDHSPEISFASPIIQDVHARVSEAAATGMRLMLLGPTGAGKDVLARCYHRHSLRRRGPFVAVNCALLRGELLHAQLFGARRGSFTGCVSDLPGLVEAAHDGTLFLDEVGDMDGETQRALLRFLDARGEYQRLGDTRPYRSDVQLVCATHVDLSDPAVRNRHFREDLWYRVAVRVVHVPPLRERPEDIVAILRTRCLRDSSISVLAALTPKGLDRVLSDPWPGNLRDLDNFLSRLPSAAHPRSLDEDVVLRALMEGRPTQRPDIPARGLDDGDPPYRQVVPLGESQWAAVSARASQAFVADFGAPPRGWGQMQTYTEKYLKPVFIAQSAGLSRLRVQPDHVNYSDLARRLDVADGSTIKAHLTRYFERFGSRVQTARQSPTSCVGTD